MTLRDRLTKNALLLLVLVYYLGGYFSINAFTEGRGHFHILGLPYEEKIPFLPIFILGYAMVFILIGMTYLLIDDLGYFKKVVKAFLLCITIHFAIFLLFPVEYNLRPTIGLDQGGIYQFVHFYYWLDLPYNNFPSLHISNAFMIAFILDEYQPRLQYLVYSLAILIAVSVVLVKQHYIVDVAAGFLVGWVVYRMIFKPGRLARFEALYALVK